MKKEEMRTTDIKGKKYVEVNQRILYFRSNYPNGKILTSIETMDNGIAVVRAEIYVGEELIATGHAYEKEGSTFINKTSYLENCETSAIGRALGIFGIGIDTSIASSEEVLNAIKQQKEKPKENKLSGAKITMSQIDKIQQLIKNDKIDSDRMKKFYKVATIQELNYVQAEQIIKGKESK